MSETADAEALLGPRAARAGAHRLISTAPLDGDPASARAAETPGFPEALRQLSWAGALAAGADPRAALHRFAPETGALSVRPVLSGGRAATLIERLALAGAPPTRCLEVWAVDADLFAAHGPALVAALATAAPGWTDPSVGAAAVEAALTGGVDPSGAEDGAAALLAALASETESAPFTQADFPLSEGFWRAVAGLADALPPGLRPLLSASAGFRAPLEALLVSYLPQQAPSAQPRGAPDELARVGARLAGALSVGWRGADEAATDLRNLMQDAAAGAAQDGLRAFLTDRAAAPARPPADPHHREVHLRRLIAAAHTGAAFREPLAGFGRARAAALLATLSDPESASAWDYVRRTQPARLFWSALLLRDPDWLEPEPIGSLRALSRLFAFDASVRAALPAEAPTPLDGPAFKDRMRRLAAVGAALLDFDPDALLEEAGADGAPEVAVWVRRAPDLFAELPPAAREEIGRTLDAIEAAAAARRADGGAAMAAAVDQVRRASLRERSASRPGLEDPTAARSFAQRWMAAAEAGALDAAAFWKSAFEGWFERAAEASGADAPLDALIAFRRRLNAENAAHGAVLTALDAATERFLAARGAEARPSDRLLEAFAGWRRLWAQGGARAAAAARGPLMAAAESPGAAETATERAFGEATAKLLAKMLENRETPGARLSPAQAADALTAGIEGLELFERLAARCPEALRPALRAQQAALISALDVASGTPVEDTSERALAVLERRRPGSEARLVLGAARAVLGWSLGPDPRPVWPEATSGALAERITRRMGGALALYAGDYPNARSAAAVGMGPPLAETAEAGAPEGGPADWAAFLADHQAAADRTLAINAVALWRRRYAEALAARATDPIAAETPVSLAPHGAEAVDALVWAALERLLTADREAARAADAGTEGAETALGADLDGLIGADARWTLRQFSDLSLDAKARPAHRAAPETVRQAWADIAYGAENDAGTAEGFFLFLASRLTAAGAAAIAAGASPDPLSAPFLSLLRERHYDQRLAVGKLVSETKGALRAYVWQRPGTEERGAAFEALEDAQLAARMDRALLLHGLVALDESEPPGAPALKRLWAPLGAAPKDVARLNPPKGLLERLSRFLKPEDPSALDPAHRHYRAALGKVLVLSRSMHLPLWQSLVFDPAR